MLIIMIAAVHIDPISGLRAPLESHKHMWVHPRGLATTFADLENHHEVKAGPVHPSKCLDSYSYGLDGCVISKSLHPTGMCAVATSEAARVAHVSH